MKKKNRSPYLRNTGYRILLSFILVISSVCAGELLPGRMRPQPVRAAVSTRSANSNHGEKVSEDLRERANRPTAAQDQVNVILQFRDKPSDVAETALSHCGAKTKGDYRNLNTRAVQMPASAVNDLAALDEVAYVSTDREVRSSGHLSATTGADLVRSIPNSTGSELDGSGIGIAVLDSGVYMNHASFSDRSGKRRVVADQNFTVTGDQERLLEELTATLIPTIFKPLRGMTHSNGRCTRHRSAADWAASIRCRFEPPHARSPGALDGSQIDPHRLGLAYAASCLSATLDLPFSSPLSAGPSRSRRWARPQPGRKTCGAA